MLKKLSKNARITLSVLFAFFGLCLISYNYFDGIKNNVFNYQNIKLLEQRIELAESLEELDEPEEINEIISQVNEAINDSEKDNYIGYLEVPDVEIKRGFVALGSKYNSVGYNVMLIEGSTMPDQENGNLILAAHRGNSAVSFFDKLYKLNDGAFAYVTYNGKKYKYQLKNRYLENKDGSLTITRNANATVLTLITCTRNDKTTQTVFIFELVGVE